MEQCFLLLLNKLLLEVGLFFRRWFILLAFHHGLVLFILFVDFFHVAFKFVDLCDLVKNLITAVALIGEKNKLAKRFSLKHIIKNLYICSSIFRVMNGKFSPQDVDQLHRVWTLIKHVIKLLFKLSLIVNKLLAQKHLGCFMNRLSIYVFLLEGQVSQVDFFLLVDHRVPFHNFLHDLSKVKDAAIDKRAATLYVL